MKIQPPKNYPGAQDRSLFEFQRWIIAVSGAMGINPPATLEEVGEQSVVPILSQLKDNARNIDAISKATSSIKKETAELKIQIEALTRNTISLKQENNELRRKIDDIERSI